MSGALSALPFLRAPLALALPPIFPSAARARAPTFESAARSAALFERRSAIVWIFHRKFNLSGYVGTKVDLSL